MVLKSVVRNYSPIFQTNMDKEKIPLSQVTISDRCLHCGFLKDKCNCLVEFREWEPVKDGFDEAFDELKVEQTRHLIEALNSR